MNCCNTANASIDCQVTFPDIVSSGMRCRAAMIMAYLGKMVTPEPTDRPQAYPVLYESRIFGAVKALVWVAVSIGIGIVMATLCNWRPSGTANPELAYSLNVNNLNFMKRNGVIPLNALLSFNFQTFRVFCVFRS